MEKNPLYQRRNLIVPQWKTLHPSRGRWLYGSFRWGGFRCRWKAFKKFLPPSCLTQKLKVLAHFGLFASLDSLIGGGSSGKSAVRHRFVVRQLREDRNLEIPFDLSGSQHLRIKTVLYEHHPHAH